MNGRVEWIGLRGARQAGAGTQAPTSSGSISEVTEVEVDESGLVGDRYSKVGGKRAVTLFQAEHIPVLEALTGIDDIGPTALRRNLVVRGINLAALKRARFRVGDAVLEGTGDCHPCSKMDETIGPGGHEAMRGHGGITARVVKAGTIRVGDVVTAEPDE